MDMKIIHLENIIDNTKEQEIYSDDEYGLDVLVIYSEDSWINKQQNKQVIDVFNNCTEIHYMYDSKNKRIAFESDIHQSGCNHSIDDIETIVIKLSTERNINFIKSFI